MSLYDNVIPLVPRNLSQFGVCPRCGSAEGPISFHGQQWLFCSTHRLRWYIGTYQIGGWQLNVGRIFGDVMEAERLKGLWETKPHYPGQDDWPDGAA